MKIVAPILVALLLAGCGGKKPDDILDGSAPRDAQLDAAVPLDAADPPDAVSDAGTVSDAVVAADVSPDACSPPYTGFTLTLDTSGGMSGQGYRDYQLTGTSLTVFDYFHNPQTCTGTLTTTQMNDLLALANQVGWPVIDPDMRPPNNLTCCCDQFVWNLSISLTQCAGGTENVTTVWCDESLSLGLVPQALQDFVTALDQIATQILAGCVQSS